VLAVVSALGLLAAACSGGSDDPFASGDQPGSGIDPDCIVVDAAVSSEKIELLTELADEDALTHDPLLVSIAAGVSTDSIEKAAQRALPIVRAMPNTPAAIGRGITVAVAAEAIAPAQRAIVDALLRATGGVEWVDDEALMDAVTAVSGSGPAYVFLLAEELARAGVAAGLPAGLAARLARETVAGSGELLHRSDLDAATLRQNVTSPGGTTAAALGVLMGDDGFRPLLARAVAAATARSRELAK